MSFTNLARNCHYFKNQQECLDSNLYYGHRSPQSDLEFDTLFSAFLKRFHSQVNIQEV